MKKIIIATGLILTALSFANAGYYNYSDNTCGNSLSRELSLGSQDSYANNDVSTLQEFLVNNGYLNARVTGYFGYATKNAVKNYQRDNGLSPMGIVGIYTRNLINDSLCSGSSYNNYGNNYSYVPPATSIPTTYVNPVDQYNYNSVNQLYPLPVPAQVYPYNNSSPYYYGYNYNQYPSPTLTINNPSTFASFREGDTVNVSWTATNLNANSYQVTLENTSSSQVSVVTNLAGNTNTASFVLTKALLDIVCGTGCNQNSQYAQSNFRINVIASYNDAYANYGNTATKTLKAYVDRITITRPYSYVSGISVTPSKTPVSSGEMFKLYLTVNNSNVYPYNVNTFSNGYFYNVRMVCPTNTALTFNGVACGQTISGFQNNASSMPDINITVVNNSWNYQNVQFVVDVYNQYGGILLGSATTNVVVNR